MEVSDEDLPEEVIPISVVLDRVFDGRPYLLEMDEGESQYYFPIDEESLERLLDASPPFGSGNF